MTPKTTGALPETCCGGTRSRIGCEYHDPALQPAAPASALTNAQIKALYNATIGGIPLRPCQALAFAAGRALPAGARLLGPDDPEVLGHDTPPDLIYAVPGGGVVGVPQVAAASAAAPAKKPKIDRTTQWRTKDGRVMLFTEMSDTHLGHTIRMLIRKYEENLSDSWSAAASFDSDSMASYYACGMAEDVRPHSSLRHLQAEATRRGLSW